MRLTLFLLACTVLGASCTDTNEPNLNKFTLYFRNESPSFLELEVYDHNKSLSLKSISPSSQLEICTYSWENFVGLDPSCQIDSVIFRFDNKKGYLATGTTTSYDFIGKHPFGTGYVSDVNDRIFIITEEDFDNAHELPE